MSASVRASVVVLLVTLAIHGAPAGAQDQHPLPGGKDRWATKTATQDGVELSVEVDRQSFAGGALAIRITIRNNGKAKLRTIAAGILKTFAIQVFSDDGTPVPLTRYGRTKLAVQGTGGKSRTLPHGTYYAQVYILSRLFDLTMSGQYSLTVSKKYYSLDMSRSASLQVTDVGFEVGEPKSKDWAAIWRAPKD